MLARRLTSWQEAHLHIYQVQMLTHASNFGSSMPSVANYIQVLAAAHLRDSGTEVQQQHHLHKLHTSVNLTSEAWAGGKHKRLQVLQGRPIAAPQKGQRANDASADHSQPHKAPKGPIHPPLCTAKASVQEIMVSVSASATMCFVRALQ